MTLPSLRLHNTLTRRKEVFAPIDPAHVRLYACGPTVYDRAHIGNARPVIVFDLLFRLLRLLAEAGAFDGGRGETRVTYVRNITDVDDKINARAARDFPGIALNEAIRRVTAETERQFHEDIRALGIIAPADLGSGPHRMIEPRATDHIEAMRALIDRLVASGHAYAAEDNVLFHVPAMADYGELSRRPLDEMEAGARVDVAPYKRSPLDFVLWKPSKEGEPGWMSPAGILPLGRPGWHIECSAMAWQHLGERFDIHAGGLDLIFPHHENEIAQSRCAFGTASMANYWLHNGFLQVEGEKMSKSLGNFVTIRDVLDDWPGEVIRLTMLKTHYRQPIDWTLRSLQESERTLDRWNRLVAEMPLAEAVPRTDLLDALADDLGTPSAIAILHGMFGSEAGPSDQAAWDVADPADAAVAVASARMLGLMAQSPAAWATGKRRPALDPALIDAWIERRLAARASKDWAESDRIRDDLKGLGVILKDNRDGTTTWEAAR